MRNRGRLRIEILNRFLTLLLVCRNRFVGRGSSPRPEEFYRDDLELPITGFCRPRSLCRGWYHWYLENLWYRHLALSAWSMPYFLPGIRQVQQSDHGFLSCTKAAQVRFFHVRADRIPWYTWSAVLMYCHAYCSKCRTITCSQQCIIVYNYFPNLKITSRSARI